MGCWGLGLEAVGCEHGHALSVQIPHCGGVCCLHSGHGVPSWCRVPPLGCGVPCQSRVPSWAQCPPLGAGSPFLSTGSLLGHSVPPLGARSPFLGVGSPLRAGSPPGHGVPLWVPGPLSGHRVTVGCRLPFLSRCHHAIPALYPPQTPPGTPSSPPSWRRRGAGWPSSRPRWPATPRPSWPCTTGSGWWPPAAAGGSAPAHGSAPRPPPTLCGWRCGR